MVVREFAGFAVHWGFSDTLSTKRELDVSDPRMNEQDYQKKALSPRKLCKTHNTWYYFPRSAGTKMVKELIACESFYGGPPILSSAKSLVLKPAQDHIFLNAAPLATLTSPFDIPFQHQIYMDLRFG